MANKYIDAEKLKKIVEQAKQRALKGAKVDKDLYCDGRADAFGEVLLDIDSLQQEQQEVDLEKEIGKFLDETGAPYFWCGDDEQKEWCSVIAHHFYELGLKARKK